MKEERGGGREKGRGRQRERERDREEGGWKRRGVNKQNEDVRQAVGGQPPSFVFPPKQRERERRERDYLDE